MDTKFIFISYFCTIQIWSNDGRMETYLLPGLVQPRSEQDGGSILYCSVWVLPFNIISSFPIVSKLFENSALGTADEGKDFIEVKFYYMNGLSKAFSGE